MEFEVWDILDVLIVAILLWQIVKLLKGTAAFNIFIGVILLYFIYWVVGKLEMPLLSLVLGKFVAYGVIILIIIFQPEVRRFLVMMGNTTLKGRVRFINRIFKRNDESELEVNKEIASEIENALYGLQKDKTGALIVLTTDEESHYFMNSGTLIDATVSDILLRNLFAKSAPLHDGAVIISNQRIKAASVILPLSEDKKISKNLGLRHRAAIGASELTNAAAYVVSEETGDISYVHEGKIKENLSKQSLKRSILKHL